MYSKPWITPLSFALVCSAALDAAPKRKLSGGIADKEADCKRMPPPQPRKIHPVPAASLALPGPLPGGGGNEAGMARALPAQPVQGPSNQEFKGSESKASGTQAAGIRDPSARIVLEVAKGSQVIQEATGGLLRLDESGCLKTESPELESVEVKPPLAALAVTMRNEANHRASILGASLLPPVLFRTTFREVLDTRNELFRLILRVEGPGLLKSGLIPKFDQKLCELIFEEVA